MKFGSDQTKHGEKATQAEFARTIWFLFWACYVLSRFLLFLLTTDTFRLQTPP